MKSNLEEQVYTMGQIFRFASRIARGERGAKDAEYSNAMRYPFKFVPQMVILAHQLKKVSEEQEKVLAGLYDKIDYDTVIEYMDTPLTLQMQSQFVLGYMQEINMDSFVHGLKAIRKARGMTLETLARKSGVTSRMLMKYEAGENKPPVDKAIRLAEVLNCSVNNLFD